MTTDSIAEEEKPKDQPAPVEGEIKEVKTPNMWLACAYITAGRARGIKVEIVPSKSDKSNPDRVSICLRGPTKLLQDVEDEWWNGGSPYRLYSETFRDISQFVHS